MTRRRAAGDEEGPRRPSLVGPGEGCWPAASSQGGSPQADPTSRCGQTVQVGAARPRRRIHATKRGRKSRPAFRGFEAEISVVQRESSWRSARPREGLVSEAFRVTRDRGKASRKIPNYQCCKRMVSILHDVLWIALTWQGEPWCCETDIVCRWMRISRRGVVVRWPIAHRTGQTGWRGPALFGHTSTTSGICRSARRWG